MATATIGTRQALRVVVRAMRLSLGFKWELAVKAATQMTSLFWILILPWPGKIVIDYIVLGDGARSVDSVVPFFFLPFLAIVEPLDPANRAWAMGGIFLAMLLLIGAYGIDGAQRESATAWLGEGEDPATRSENQANAMSSLVSGAFGLFESLWEIRISHRLNHYLRSELFRRFAAQRVTDFHDRAIGDVVYRALYDTPSISTIVFNLWVGPPVSLLNIGLTIFLMFVIFGAVPAVVWCALAIAPLNFLIVVYFAKLLRKHGTLAREAGSRTTAIIEEGVSNVMAVQGLSSEKGFDSRFAEASDYSFKTFRRLVRINLLASYCATVVAATMIFVVFYFAAPAFIERKFDPGDWWVIWGYFGSIATASGYLGVLWLRLQESIAALQRVFSILDRPVEELEDLAAVGSLPADFKMHRGIALQAVDFDYPDGTAALREIDFAANVGEMVALVGPTGSGKSTLAALIPGLLVPTSGRYVVDDIECTGRDLAVLRRQVAFVFQEPSIFDDTVEGNIRMGRREANDEETREAAKQAGAAEFIEQLPQGYRTPLGRAGAKLSVGQKQRLAIARALVAKKPVLVLDEPTAALDPETENLLVANLRRARAGRLVVVIAHRLSTIRAADRICFLEEGRIIEQGSHAELVALGKRYAGFVAMQELAFREIDR